ncbi:hypothetical protein AV530_008596 [Patagioenas fasciata monilis]|uniref:Uncharacterized protein n=1 Tax=Patagioenas fasciata monilis TaxID=372326 RepID=A0A1V4KXX1_PATFA|nr:hypothetical protein AV530_008596 [Patagioenas fasciata monilis]
MLLLQLSWRKLGHAGENPPCAKSPREPGPSQSHAKDVSGNVGATSPEAPRAFAQSWVLLSNSRSFLWLEDMAGSAFFTASKFSTGLGLCPDLVSITDSRILVWESGNRRTRSQAAPVLTPSSCCPCSCFESMEGE